MFINRKKFTFLSCPSKQDCRVSWGQEPPQLLFTQQHTAQNEHSNSYCINVDYVDM